jgi:hypothetical protein
MADCPYCELAEPALGWAHIEEHWLVNHGPAERWPTALVRLA